MPCLYQKNLIVEYYAPIPSPKSEFVVICCFGNEERFPETPMLLRFREIRFASFPKQPAIYLSLRNFNLVNTINDILDFSNMETNKKLEYMPFSLGKILKKLAKLFKEKIAAKGLILRIINKGFSQRIIGDPIRLEKILFNLINNAIEFTQTGAITIYIAQISNHGDDITLQFSVEDTGIGISEAAISSLFDSQATSSTTRKVDNELGLTMCQHLINVMDGKIWLESKLNKGTIVHFILTFKIDSHKATKASNQQTIKILLVEDNLINQRLIKLILTKKGFLVYVASNGIEAIEMIEKNYFDVVLMDIQMPEMGGNEATKLIRENPKYANLPIIAMTANTTTDDKEKSLEAGMNDYITKPIDTNELFNIITRWV